MSKCLEAKKNGNFEELEIVVSAVDLTSMRNEL